MALRFGREGEAVFERVLMAVDFSSSLAPLVSRAKALVSFGCERVELVHVLSTRYPHAPAESHREHYQSRLDEIVSSFAADGLEAKGSVRVGEPGRELVKAAGEAGCGLILAGKRGRSRFKEALLGSTALDLARLTDRPLWLEPDSGKGGKLGCVLLATDGSEAAAGAEKMFASITPLAGRAIAMEVVGTADGEDEGRIELDDARRGLDELAAKTGGIETRAVEGYPATEIVKAAEAEGADLIVIGKRGRSKIERLLLGSVAETVCRTAKCAVLLVPA
ncbi:MAG: universal stress protein [Phycisphaerales bacterium]|nr:MAG: universal stress protein [Phycisphaerales bacterium]